MSELSKLIEPPFSPVRPVTDVLHGVAVADPYRWLEDQDLRETRDWLAAQTLYARSYLDAIDGRDRIRERIHEFLAVETYDSVCRFGARYFFRKRLPDQEQPCLYMREGPHGPDQLLLDPQGRGTGKYTAVKPLRVSPDGRLLLYEVKEGGERTGTFELLDIETRRTLPEVLSRGYLRGFAFAPDGSSFYYVHETAQAMRPLYRAVYHHILGTSFQKDTEIFSAGEGEKLRIGIIPGKDRLGFLVYRFAHKTRTDFYLWTMGLNERPECIIRDFEYAIRPVLLEGLILASTDFGAPNLRLVEIRPRKNQEPELVDIVPERTSRISDWAVADGCIFVAYVRGTRTRVDIFDLAGTPAGELPVADDETVRLMTGSPETDGVLLESESFTRPCEIHRFSIRSRERELWARQSIPFKSEDYAHTQVWFKAKDGTLIPMVLVSARNADQSQPRPAIMTAYGGYGVSMTPQFSVLVGFLLERGWLFALPNIRGGSEFGATWHQAAKRRTRQVAIDDFLGAAEWLIETRKTAPERLAIFGGSNSGLLVGAALTQRPDLFRAVLCMVPMLDMIRYHLFDNAAVWKGEFGTSDDPEDFAALLRYSPYHAVRDGVDYPATMIVSGDLDKNCNPLHARKMTARLQAASASRHPIILDYNEFRGHSPVLPLSTRTSALADRLAFLCKELGVPF